MERSKQQAMMFLLGAVLVGGALGFSADRVFNARPKNWMARTRMYDDLGLSETQRSRMDSLLDYRNCQIGAVMKPLRPHLDSIKEAAHHQMLQILTPEQQANLERRRAEMVRKDSLDRARRDSLAAKSTNGCRG
jgi:Spy/CpxP family protein refolding chaperone